MNSAIRLEKARDSRLDHRVIQVADHPERRRRIHDAHLALGPDIGLRGPQR
jgi:hypothetical protein